MTTTSVPVLIIGGGIVGLSASLFLSTHNIPHLLVERHSGTSIHPRARGVNARTMELYRSLGIDEEVRDAGAELAPSMGVFSGSTLAEVIEPQKRKESSGAAVMPGATLFEGVSPSTSARGTQDLIEPVLLRASKERGGEVRFYTECVSFEQTEERVTATLRDREIGNGSTVHADYVIAADGAGSPTRKKLGVNTTGKGTLGYLLNILFHADLKELVRGRKFSLCLIERPEVCGVFTSINNSDRWVFHLSYDPSKGEKAEDFTPERCEYLLHLALGLPDVKVDIKSILPWESMVRVVEKLQHGRIFLAGDAAHTMPPWGGQGANSGIADVHNLAWKLAAVIKGRSSPKLLETYDVERLPVGRRAAYKSGELADERGLLMAKDFTKISSVIFRVPMLFGYGYTYASNAIIPEYLSWLAWMWFLPWTIASLFLGLNGSPGTRAPHIWTQHDGRRISTLDLFGRTFVLIAGSDGKPWCEAASDVASELGIQLVAYRAGPTGDLSDPKHLWQSAAGISSRGALLIRPDGFVAWRVQDQPADPRAELGHILKQVLYL